MTKFGLQESPSFNIKQFFTASASFSFSSAVKSFGENFFPDVLQYSLCSIFRVFSSQVAISGRDSAAKKL